MSLLPITQIEESDYGDELWFGGDGCGLITVGEWSAGGCKSHSPKDWAELQTQANLIAAAPDLLEALQAARDLWGDYLPPGNSNAMRAMKLVDAAITKALTGESK